MKKSTLVGVVVTVVWLLGAVAFLWYRWPAEGMKPNEIGDYIAGFVSPLAFLWLVLGYRQQGDELALNTEALRLQVEELKLSVEAQKELSVATSKRLELESRKDEAAREEKRRLAQPRLILANYDVSNSTSSFYFDLAFTNMGGSISKLMVMSNLPAISLEPDEFALVPSAGKFRINLSLNKEEIPAETKLFFVFDDARGESSTQEAHLTISRDPRRGAVIDMVGPAEDLEGAR